MAARRKAGTSCCTDILCGECRRAFLACGWCMVSPIVYRDVPCSRQTCRHTQGAHALRGWGISRAACSACGMCCCPGKPPYVAGEPAHHRRPCSPGRAGAGCGVCFTVCRCVRCPHAHTGHVGPSLSVHDMCGAVCFVPCALCSDACDLVNVMINFLPSRNPDLERRVEGLSALMDRVDDLERHLTCNEVREC